MWCLQDACGVVQSSGSAQCRACVRLCVSVCVFTQVRVWGGGRYQVASLYEWCDREGVMVWQEFMFACSPYPTAADFIHEVLRLEGGSHTQPHAKLTCPGD